MQYFHDISIDAIYRDIFYDIFQVKIGLKSSNFIPGAPMTLKSIIQGRLRFITKAQEYDTIT